MVRNPAWQQDFLAKPPQERLEIALQARDASAEHKGNVEMAIMDVNSTEVIAAFERHGVRKMIHGHTHRPAIHDLTIEDGDWYTQSSALRVKRGSFELETGSESETKVS